MKTFRQFLKENKHIIYEMSAAIVNKNPNRMIWVENPNGYNNKYFKYLDSDSYIKSKKVKRISLLKPEYMEHKDENGKIEWNLNNKEIDKMISILSGGSVGPNNLTNWQKVLATYNQDNCSILMDPLLLGEISKEEYNKKVDENNKKHNKRAFRLDYQMPNYELLKTI